MADISRNTTPAWQDPHLKDRGDYSDQDIQNSQEKGGILPDFTLDEAEETHLFARVAQALSKTLTRQCLAVRHEAKAAAEPMGYRLDEHAIAIDTRRPWKDIALDLAHALGAGMPTMLIVDMDRSDAAGLDLVRRAATRESTFQGSVSECIRQAQATAPGYDPAPDEGPTGLWPAANMFPDPAALPGAMPMETPDRPGPAQDAGMDGPAIGA